MFQPQSLFQISAKKQLANEDIKCCRFVQGVIVESVTMTCVAQMFKCYVEYYNQCSVRRRPHCPARPHQSRLTRSFFLELATNLCEVSHCPKCLIRFLMLEVLAGAFNKERVLLGHQGPSRGTAKLREGSLTALFLSLPPRADLGQKLLSIQRCQIREFLQNVIFGIV